MSAIEVSVNQKVPLNLVLEDGATDKFPRAHLFDQDGNEVPGSPFVMVHQALGLYTNNDYTAQLFNQCLYAVYRVYDDNSYAEESANYVLRSEDIFVVLPEGIPGSSSGFFELDGELDPDSGEYELMGVVESA